MCHGQYHGLGSGTGALADKQRELGDKILAEARARAEALGITLTSYLDQGRLF